MYSLKKNKISLPSIFANKKPRVGNTLKQMIVASIGTVSLLVPLYTATAQQSKATPALVAKYKEVSNVPSSIRQKTDIAISNYPLFLLSEAVTKGAPSGKLLLGAGDVGHHGSLSPEGIKTVRDSRYVVWFGHQLESNLVKPLSKSHNTISLFDMRGFTFRPVRDVKAQAIEDTLDPHIWLDPENAKAITRALGALYSRANPEYKSVYQANVREFAKQMDKAASQVKSSTKSRPYWAYHDAFGYIEPVLNLDMVGALTTDHHLPPKASQFHWLKQNRPQKTMCILLQSDSNQGVLSKLAPTTSSVQQEDMSHASDFISGWLDLAKDINSCIEEAQ